MDTNQDCAKKDCHNLEMEILKMGVVKEPQILPLQQLHEIGDMIQSQQCKKSAELASGISQLYRLSEVLQNESIDYSGDLPTSFVSAEIQLAKYISECLSCDYSENLSSAKIQSLLRDYRVVQPLPNGKHSLSLHKVYLILQDNYPNSSLCGLFNLLLCGRNNGVTKVITF